MICPKCGEAMRMVEKDTSSGRDIREYECTVCGYSDWEDRGAALWQILSDDRAESQASEADRDPGSGRDVEPPLLKAERNPASSAWGRLLALLKRLNK